MLLTTIRNRRYDDSSDSESDDNDEEYVTDDCQTARNERQHKIPFFGRKERTAA